MHKDTRIVTYIDNFLSKDELDNLQKKAVAFDYNSNNKKHWSLRFYL